MAKIKAKHKPGPNKESAEARYARFVEAYLSNGNNAANAALVAGYSAKTAVTQGGRLLKHVHVQQLLQQRRTVIAQINELSTNEIMADMARALRFDPRKLYREDGTLKPIHELDDDTALCLTGIETVIVKGTEGSETPLFVKKLKWESKAVSRDQAMKVFGMYEKDNQQKAGALEGLPRELLQAMVQRLKALNGQP